MLSYCLRCREKTGSKSPRVVKTKKNGRIMILSKCTVCGGTN